MSQPDKGVDEERGARCRAQGHGLTVAGTCSWCGADVAQPAPETKAWPPQGIETK